MLEVKPQLSVIIKTKTLEDATINPEFLAKKKIGIVKQELAA